MWLYWNSISRNFFKPCYPRVYWSLILRLGIVNDKFWFDCIYLSKKWNQLFVFSNLTEHTRKIICMQKYFLLIPNNYWNPEKGLIGQKVLDHFAKNSLLLNWSKMLIYGGVNLRIFHIFHEWKCLPSLNLVHIYSTDLHIHWKFSKSHMTSEWQWKSNRYINTSIRTYS